VRSGLRGLLLIIADLGRTLLTVAIPAGLIVIRKRFAPEPDADHEPMLASIRSGLRLMIADRVLRRDQLVWSLYSVLGGSIDNHPDIERTPVPPTRPPTP
jgi:hypothetical protein